MNSTPSAAADTARRAAIRRTVAVLVACAVGAYALFFYSVIAGK